MGDQGLQFTSNGCRLWSVGAVEGVEPFSVFLERDRACQQWQMSFPIPQGMDHPLQPILGPACWEGRIHNTKVASSLPGTTWPCRKTVNPGIPMHQSCMQFWCQIVKWICVRWSLTEHLRLLSPLTLGLTS
jgi:hypothetical protein